MNCVYSALDPGHIRTGAVHQPLDCVDRVFVCRLTMARREPFSCRVPAVD